MRTVTPPRIRPPYYYVTMCDMFNLLLAFYICMVSFADTRMGALIGAGHGPFVKDIISRGKPGLGTGDRPGPTKPHPRDGWWIPDQRGDPDQLRTVAERIERELPIRFKPGEATVSYQRQGLILVLPARLECDADGSPRLTAAVQSILRQVADLMRRAPECSLRISGDVPASGSVATDLYDSARQGQLAYVWLQRLGVEPGRLSLWGWGAGRPVLADRPTDPANRGLTLELIDLSGGAPAETR
jgi:outer membrane protein OmpA-like peptidoglycan-associated protein